MALRALVVDDHPDIQGFIQALLEGEGYDVATASNGDEALALLAERGADVVITDLFMPERDGFETIEVLKERYPDTAVVAISGGRETPGRTTPYLSVARVAGADRTLRKPISAKELFTAVREALAHAKRR